MKQNFSIEKLFLKIFSKVSEATKNKEESRSGEFVKQRLEIRHFYIGSQVRENVTR